jgi:aminoglycoside phosphotransferase (APT) family kinase protein
VDELGALEEWLGQRLGREVRLTHEGKPGSGFSAETTILRSGDEKFVLRKETPDPPVYPRSTSSTA